MAMPVRFRNYEELSERQREQRFDRFHRRSLKAKDLQPLLRGRFRPILRKCGFIQASESLSHRAVEPHYVHFLRLCFSAVFPGRFFVRAGIALDFLPLSDWTAFDPKRVSLDVDCLFTKEVTLPNGNPEFDNGINLAEANETIDYLIVAFKRFDRDYFQKFKRFPAPVEALGVDFVRRLTKLVEQNSESEFGVNGATVEFFTLRLALIQKFLGHMSKARKLLEYGLACYELFDLKKRYSKLLRDLV